METQKGCPTENQQGNLETSAVANDHCKVTENSPHLEISEQDFLATKVIAENAICATEDEAAKLWNIIKDSFVSSSEPIVKDDFLFSVYGISAFQYGSIVTVKAKPKDGKSFVSSFLTRTMLDGGNSGITSNAKPTDTVCYIDTEMSRNGTRIQLRRSTDGKNYDDRLLMLNVKMQSFDERMAILKAVCALYEPRLIVIDGIADLVAGMAYNEQELSGEVVNTINALAEKYNAVILCIIHENKKDTNSTGWLGRLLLQKCTMELSIKRDGQKRTLECSACRGREMPPINFEIVDSEDGYGRLKIVSPEEAEAEKNEASRQAYRDKILNLGINPPLGIKRDEFTKLVRERKSQIEAKPCRPQAASNFVRHCIESGAVRLDNDTILFDYVS